MPRVFLSTLQLSENYRRLGEALPGCQLFYACKTNSDRGLLRHLIDCNALFDVATNGEIDILNDLGVQLTDSNCIHTHPIKSVESIDYAISRGVKTFVVDNFYEVDKLVGKQCDVLIRISFPNPNVKVDLSSKFGVHPDQFMDLYTACVDAGVLVRGISFHVGSNCGNSDMHVSAIKKCLPFMQTLALRTLDIGGGFPCFASNTDQPNIDLFCAAIREVLEGCPFEVIAEPGRYIVANAVYMHTKVIGKAIRGDIMSYYLDSGVYDMFSGIIYDHNIYNLEAPAERSENVQLRTQFYGPTCDSIDKICEYDEYPELLIGDEVLVRNIGAYSNATSCAFNSLPLPIINVI